MAQVTGSSAWDLLTLRIKVVAANRAHCWASSGARGQENTGDGVDDGDDDGSTVMAVESQNEDQMAG